MSENNNFDWENFVYLLILLNANKELLEKLEIKIEGEEKNERKRNRKRIY